MAKAVVRFYGGFGNQMYQYSFGKYLESIGYDVFFDKSALRKSKVQHETFILEQFFNDIRFVGSISSKLLWLLARLGLISMVSEKRRCDDRDFSILNPKGLTVFSGYWQNICYHDVDRLNFAQSRKRIHHDPYAVVHVRRGDYVGHTRIRCLDAAYYNRTIEMLKAAYGIPIYVVTDDRDWVKKNLCIDNYQLVSSTLIDDWFLMSQSSVLSIANSSFSLWAALIGKVPVVYQPKYWLKDNSNTMWGKNDWIVLDNEIL